MKKTHKNMTLGMALGMCLGVAIGCIWGESVFVNTGTGMSIGLCAGMFIGMALGTLKDNAVNKQLEEQTVIVSKGELESETLSVRDIVYLDEDGSLEQAYDDMEV